MNVRLHSSVLHMQDLDHVEIERLVILFDGTDLSRFGPVSIHKSLDKQPNVAHVLKSKKAVQR